MMDGLTLPPSPMQALQAEHERLLGRLDDAGGVPYSAPKTPPIENLSLNTQALIHEARAYIERAKIESEWISDGRDRSQLRANLRFWASYLVNCTGAYPDTTLRPARPYMAEFPSLASKPPVIYGDEVTNGITAPIVNETAFPDLDEIEPEGAGDEEGITFGNAEGKFARPAWFSRLSRFFGLIAILIVGVVPLAAVCLALSLFYSLDNQSPRSAGDVATQTAIVVQQIPSPTPLPVLTKEAGPTPGLPPPNSIAEQPLLFAQVTTGEPLPEGSACAPVLALSLDTPKTAGGAPIPPANVAVFLAGSDVAVASVVLEPGAAPQLLSLEPRDPAAQEVQGWFLQADHPWMDVEAVILPGSLFGDCAQNQISIVYRPRTGAEVWQQVAETDSQGDLRLSWKLLTWGPEALEAETWVAAVSLQAAGGDGNYVYSASGDLAVSPAGNLQGVVLPADQAILEQAFCVSAVAEAGVTSAGESVSRALALQLVLPECR